MTKLVKKTIANTTAENIREHVELTVLVSIFVLSIFGVTP